MFLPLGCPSSSRKWVTRVTQKPSWLPFEELAAAACWPQEHWAILIAPYLMGPAQVAYRILDPIEALDYVNVEAASLDYMVINPETFHQ